MYIQYRAGDNFFFLIEPFKCFARQENCPGRLNFPNEICVRNMKRLPGRKIIFTSPRRQREGGGRGKWHVCVSGLIQRIEYDEGVMGRCSRWWHEMNRREKSDIRNLNNHVSGTAGEQNSAGSLNRQPNRPNKNHLPRPSTPVLKGLGKEKWGNPPLHCTDHAFNLRSIHPRSNHLNTICLLVH